MYTEEQKQQLAKRQKEEKRQELIDAIMTRIIEAFICLMIGGGIGYLFGLAWIS